MVALVLVLVAIAVYADQRSRAAETRALDTCRRELHGAAVTSDQQMLAVATTTHGPLASSKGDPLGLAGLMARSARLLLPDVERADAVCARVAGHPWHFSLKDRRDGSTAYSAAGAGKVLAVADDGRTSYLDDGTLRTLRRDADLEEFGGRS